MKNKIISFILIFSMILTSALYFVACDDQVDEETSGTDTSDETESIVSETDTEETIDTDADTVENTDTEQESESVSCETESGSTIETEPNTETESDTESDTESESESESETEEEETDCFHPYDATIEGHWKPACDVCGKGVGKMQSHEFEEKVEDEGDLLLYSFRCSVCKYRAYKQEVPYAINLFFSAGELSSRADVSSSYTQSFGFDSGVGFGSYTSEKGGTVTVTVMSGGDANVPTGKYLVMKVRLPKSQSSFSASIKSVGAGAAQSISFSGLPSGWVTLVVDVTTAVKSTTSVDNNTGDEVVTTYGYQPDASGDYYLGDLKVTAKTGAGESFDFAYALLCDRIEDAQTFIENEKVVITYDDALNGSGTTDKKECVDENGNPIEHKYVVNDDGTHTLTETCYQCGLAAVENEPHTYAQTEINGELTYACSACKALQFAANINKYFSAADINNTACTYFRIVRNGDNGIGIDADGGFEYMTFSSSGQTAQILFARNTADSSDLEEAASFNVGKANYFIIRMRTNTTEQPFGINFATTGSELVDGKKGGVVVGQFHTSSTLNFPTAVGGVDQWVTYVVDLTKVIPNAYAADETGNITLVNFYFHVGNSSFSTEHVFDVQYMAFVDSWEEVDALVDDETVVNVSASSAGNVVTTKDKACIGEHSDVIIQDGDSYRVECAACGTVNKVYNVSSVNVFMPAEVLINKTGGGTKTGTLDIQLMNDDDGESYLRFNNFKVNADKWGGWTPITSSSLGVTGQYMVMKLRVGDNGLGQTSLQFYINSSKSNNTPQESDPSKTYNWTTGGVSIAVSEDNEWHTVVIDLAGRLPNAFMAEDDGTYKLNYLQIRPFTSKQTLAEADDYMDIAYIAFFDELSDIPKAVDADIYEWSIDSSSSSLRNTADSSCVTHTVVEEISGTTHNVKCSACGDTLKTFEVPADINWYSNLGTMNKCFNTLEKLLYDEENGIVYNRYTLNGGTNGDHLNLTGGSGAGSADTETFTAGQYLVMKYRASAEAGIGFKVSANGVVGNNLSESLGDRKASDLHSEWTVVVIDLSRRENYTVGGEGNFYAMLTAPSKDYTFEIAYIAIVDSISEMKLLLAEGETYVDLGNSWANAGTEYNQDDTKVPCEENEHTVADVTADSDNNGNTTYTYVCSKCDATLDTVTIGAAVTKYYTPYELTTVAKQYYEPNGNGTKVVTVETDLAYAAVNNYRQLIYMRSSHDMGDKQEATAAQAGTVNVGNARYAVIKIRSSDAAAWLNLSISTEAVSGTVATATTNMPKYHKPDGTFDEWTETVDGVETTVKGVLEGNEYVNTNGYTDVSLIQLGEATDGEWVTYVIDLETVCSDSYAKAEGADDYVIDYLVVDLEGAVDIAYLAFVDGGWSDIDALVDETVVRSLTTFDGSYVNVNAVDGSAVSEE